MAEPTARLLSCLVLAPLALGAVWLGGAWLLALLAPALAVAATEWERLARPPAAARIAAGALAAALAAALLLAFFQRTGLALAVLAVGGLVIATLVRRRGAPVWPVAFGPLYLGAPAAALLWLRATPEDGLLLAIGLLAAVWATDIGAWAVGSAVGGARLAPRLSPRKTWAGAVGGGVLATAAGAALAAASGSLHPAAGALAGAALSVAAQLGDLFESWLKRRRGAKDSGAILPGHGGMLDRVDGLMGAAPALAAAVALADGG